MEELITKELANYTLKTFMKYKSTIVKVLTSKNFTLLQLNSAWSAVKASLLF